MTGGGGKNGLLFFKLPQMPLNTPLELRKLPPDICLTLMACLTSPWHSHLLTANTIWQLAWKSKHAASTASLWGENAASLPNYHIFSLRLQPPCPYSWYTKKQFAFPRVMSRMWMIRWSLAACDRHSRRRSTDFRSSRCRKLWHFCSPLFNLYLFCNVSLLFFSPT